MTKPTVRPAKLSFDQTRDVDPTTRLRQLLGVSAREWLPIEQLAKEFSFPSGSAAQQS